MPRPTRSVPNRPKARDRGQESGRVTRSGSRARPDAKPSVIVTEAPAGLPQGRVIRAHGLWYEVVLDEPVAGSSLVLATVRGQLKREMRRTDIVAVGDRVAVSLLPDREAVIEWVGPRSRALVRTARNTRDTDQVIVANLDQVLFVFAVRDPFPHVRMLDRFLVLAELQHLPAAIVVGKMDLDEPSAPEAARTVFSEYEGVYPVHFVSARTGEGLAGLRAALDGKVSAVAGPSGVGKSSLLNALDPDNLRDVGEVSVATGKGRHTTIGARLHRIGPATFVADTPGMRALAMHAIEPDALPACFPEFRPYLGGCFYQDCTHVHEPDCAIREAVERGDITRGRYESYVALRTSDAAHDVVFDDYVPDDEDDSDA
ncbi:MAG: ribosome small subunit-dependent GTPase A [Thermomicrobiales bacterium]